MGYVCIFQIITKLSLLSFFSLAGVYFRIDAAVHYLNFDISQDLGPWIDVFFLSFAAVLRHSEHVCMSFKCASARKHKCHVVFSFTTCAISSVRACTAARAWPRPGIVLTSSFLST